MCRDLLRLRKLYRKRSGFKLGRWGSWIVMFLAFEGNGYLGGVGNMGEIKW